MVIESTSASTRSNTLPRQQLSWPVMQNSASHQAQSGRTISLCLNQSTLALALAIAHHLLPISVQVTSFGNWRSYLAPKTCLGDCNLRPILVHRTEFVWD